MARLDVRAMIDRLVATPSVSAVRPELDMSNRPVIDGLATWLEDDGWAVEILPVSGGKANLLARRGTGDGGLILSGHTDTVPFDDGKWSSDPFVATERDGRLYGLGTTDMKSFLALAIAAARAFSPDALREPVWLLATADEETGMEGAKALVERGELPARRCVIGEPTNLRPIRMHKGVAMEYLSVEGSSGHSSDPSLGANAMEGMVDAILELRALRGELAERHRHDGLHPPVPTMNLGRIEGGDNPNRICAHCRVEYDIRLHPGMDVGAIRSELRRRVGERFRGRGLTLDLGGLMQPVPPFETPAEAALVRALEELSGKPAGAVSFGTEAPFLQALGAETVVFGPGEIAVAHQPDEYLPLASVEPAVDLLQQLIHRFCVEVA